MRTLSNLTIYLVISLYSIFAFPSDSHTEILLPTENHRTLPFDIVKGYIFLSGKVAEQSGGFMFDTGTPFSFLLNNHYLPLKLDHFVGSGKAGSIQGGVTRELKLYIHQDVGTIKLGQIKFMHVGALQSTNLEFMSNMGSDGLRTDNLGFVGMGLFRQYEFVIDYSSKTLDVYRIKKSGEPFIAHIDAKDVVATLPFRLAKHMPIVTINIDGIKIEGLLDTGVLGEVTLTPETQRILENSGKLKKQGGYYFLEGLNYGGIALDTKTPSISTGDSNTMRLGYNMLSHYRTVWNYKKQTVTLLKLKK